MKRLSFVEVVERLNKFWAKQGCTTVMPLDTEVGAGTFHPATFFKSLGNEKWRTAYIQPSRRPTDGRYADNPLRMQYYYQYQVLVKPSPREIKNIYLDSLKSLGIDLDLHEIRFVEDDWESPTLGAQGLGWEVWLDSLEITQFTYFQQIGGIELDMVSCEITYGIERLCMFIQNKNNVFDLEWQNGLKYGDLHKRHEIEHSKYNFDESNIDMHLKMFEFFEKEASALLSKKLVYPAYSFVLKASHAFNLLDARGAIGQSERARYIARIRSLAKRCAELYLSAAQGAATTS
ncbi:MAG: glycine--tRNA ligase subunit alpha [Candidatus Omnitrophica bacterium]|nr:glycine--tRNA ligase subunit alpha [Candidatus Omnitrophota bacterium]MBU1853878.1 glycine--tRNA ligase subunit alpha [Candidatus Omnitrophota bacterium]